MSTNIRDLWDHLGVLPDETAVVSVVYERHGDGGLTLRCGSLILGPPGIADGWPAWRVAGGQAPRPSADAIAVPATFVVDLGHAVAGRGTLDATAALRWLRSAVEHGECHSVGPLPRSRAALAIPRTPVRVSSNSETTAGALATWLCRPLSGFHFTRTDEPSHIAAGAPWTIDGTDFFSPALDLLGLAWFDGQPGSAPAGLLVGRLERRAWLAGQHLLPADSLYSVKVGIEPERADVADLELEVEERFGGELVLAERLRFEDLDLRDITDKLYGPPAPRGSRLELALALPTLGRGIQRAVRLHHRDGGLLDEWQAFHLLEAVTGRFTTEGVTSSTVRAGERRGPPDLAELLGGITRVRSEYAALRRGGLESRLFDDPAQGRAALRGLLERAPGELLVVDPWLRDWSLLENLGGPAPRVLIGPDVDAPPATFDVRVARATGQTAPFHDRFFVWDGGGVSVGTSAGSNRKRLYRIARIGAAEADDLRDRFALWWADPAFEHLR